MQFQHILRLLNTNVDGRRKIMYALTEIKGVGRRYANIVCKKADVDLKKRSVLLSSFGAWGGWRSDRRWAGEGALAKQEHADRDDRQARLRRQGRHWPHPRLAVLPSLGCRQRPSPPALRLVPLLPMLLLSSSPPPPLADLLEHPRPLDSPH